jgi:Transposase, Mutator family
MTGSIEAMTPHVDQQELAEQLVEQARAEGVDLIGPGWVADRVDGRVLNTALDVEMSEYLGYDRHDPIGRHGGNSRNGKRAKTVSTELGPVPVAVPRDRDGSLEPQIVRTRQRRLDRIDEIVLSLTARGLTTGEVAARTLWRTAWEEFIPFLDYDRDPQGQTRSIDPTGRGRARWMPDGSAPRAAGRRHDPGTTWRQMRECHRARGRLSRSTVQR